MDDPNSVIPKPDSVEMSESEWREISPQMRYYYRNRKKEMRRVDDLKEQ